MVEWEVDLEVVWEVGWEVEDLEAQALALAHRLVATAMEVKVTDDLGQEGALEGRQIDLSHTKVTTRIPASYLGLASETA